MSDEDVSEVDVDEERVATRASELHGDDDVNHEGAKSQARAILEDSEMRTRDREAAPGSFVEHRQSEDTVPAETTDHAGDDSEPG